MNTSPQLIRAETLDDLPVLWAILQRLKLPAAFDRHFPASPHWTGELTPGEVLSIWLLLILSQGDHRLNQLQPLIERHQSTLSALLQKNVRPNHGHDDRLADLLDRLAQNDSFAALETDLNQQIIRVYQLPTKVVRIDMTTVNSHAGVVSEDGLLQFGHSKDDPSRPQLKIASAVLDPLGMPLLSMVVPGNSADDPLYLPAIERVRADLGSGGRTYVGDCKMAALNTRATLAAGDDFYLCPLPLTQLSQDQRRALLQPVVAGTQLLQTVVRTDEDSDEPGEVVAEGFRVEEKLTAQVDGKTIEWVENRWLVRSLSYAASAESALDKRLEKARVAIEALPMRKQGKKRLDAESVPQAIEALLAQHQVTGLLDVDIQQQVQTRTIQAYKGQSSRQEQVVTYDVRVTLCDEAITRSKAELGWQVYATNGLEMSLDAVVWAYRDQFRVEKGWSRLKGRPLSLTPMYLQDEDRMVGLVSLLSVALRVLTLIEWEVREALRVSGESLSGIYAGQKGRKTKRPGAELLLGVMKGIMLSVVEVAGQRYALLGPLSAVQQRLLKLWGLPADLYERLAQQFPKPPPGTSEP